MKETDQPEDKKEIVESLAETEQILKVMRHKKIRRLNKWRIKRKGRNKRY